MCGVFIVAMDYSKVERHCLNFENTFFSSFFFSLSFLTRSFIVFTVQGGQNLTGTPPTFTTPSPTSVGECLLTILFS